MIKRVAILLVLVSAGFVQASHAQNHGELGAYVDYFRLHETSSNFVGVGGRAAFNIVPAVQIEADMAYDFSKAYTENFTDNSNGSVSVQRSNLRILHGMVGPKLQIPGPVRLFVTVKGGFTNFRFDNRPATFSTFTSSVDDLRTNNVNATLYPGAGVEGYLGPIGLRLDVGDQIIFSNGAHHNLSITFGPQIRF